jgi:predicted nucleic acid-binding protein
LTVAIDTSVLLYILNDQTSAPIDPSTGFPVDRCKERVNHLIDTLGAARETLIVPTLVLSEILVRASAAGPAYLQIIDKIKVVRLVDFNKRAAIEAAAMMASVISSGTKPSGPEARAKLKVDTLIMAVARISMATVMYSDDDGIKALGRRFSMNVTGVGELPLPPESTQGNVFR